MRGADRTGEKVKIKSIRDNRLAFVLGDFFLLKCQNRVEGQPLAKKFIKLHKIA